MPDEQDISRPECQRKSLHVRLQTLEIINERFARQFRLALFSLLRRRPDISAGKVVIHSFNNYSIENQQAVYLGLIELSPLRGMALFSCTAELVALIIDGLFGADDRFTSRIADRDLSLTEQSLAERLIMLALPVYNEAWKPVFDIHPAFIRSESKMKFAHITASSDERVVTTSFTIRIGSQSGQFQICLPFSMLDPLYNILEYPPPEISRNEREIWRNNMMCQVKKTHIDLVATLYEKRICLSEVMAIKKGDILTFEHPELINCTVNNSHVLSAKYGKKENKYAISVEKIMAESLFNLKKETTSNE